jgi:hypothetical protein
MKPETMLAKAAAESPGFGRYAAVMLESIPDLNMPTLRDLYKHNALPSEYWAHMARIKAGGLGRAA